MEYHGRYFGMEKELRKKRAEELMKAFSLWEKRETKTNFLSGGMKRRLVIARALMHEPKLLILSGGMKRRLLIAKAMVHQPPILVLDEPTAGVDVELRHELWQYMSKLNKQGTSILLTTHYIEEAEKLCDTISLINNGKLIKTGSVSDLKKAYKKKTLEQVYLSAIGNGKKTLEEAHL